MSEATAEWIVRDPLLIPNDLDGDLVQFVQATTPALHAAAFLDGRVRFATGQLCSARLGDLAACSAIPDRTPARTILHVSFCGSTLLSQLLDIPGRSVVLREPRIQIALADRYAARDPSAAAATSLVTRLLARPIDHLPTVTKPSNWANVLLPLWARDPALMPLFVTMAPRAFLVAVFRGGRDRIAFTMRAAQHFASVVPGGAAAIQAAVTGASDPFKQAARTVLVALALQCRLFADARADAGWRSATVIDGEHIRRDPVDAAALAAASLDLPLPRDLLAARAARIMGTDAKSPDRPFVPGDEDRANAEIESHHGATFDDALDWAASQSLRFSV